MVEVPRVVETEGVGDAVEEREHRGDVDALGHLRITPAEAPKRLHVLDGGAVGVLRDLLDVLEQGALGVRQGGRVEVGAGQARVEIGVGVLQLQEEGVAPDSVGAPIERRDVGGDHLLGAACEVAVGEVDMVGELDHVLEEVRPGAEALEDAGDARSAGPLTTNATSSWIQKYDPTGPVER